MRVLWRISNFTSLDGVGGLKTSGRWHTTGRRIVYCAENPSSALNELLVQLDKEDLPDSFRLLRIEVAEPVSSVRISIDDLPDGWRNRTEATQKCGDDWLVSKASLLLEVPSALVPHTWNVLINPEHAEAASCRIAEIMKATLDPRFA